MVDSKYKKDCLVYWLGVYERKNRILSRRLFKVYKNELIKGKLLSVKKFEHIFKFLKWDLKKSEEELWNIFDEFVKRDRGSVSLEEFMIKE
tara:strand:- start:734 stop:1006 length:273 start_codon:yes stop_codon:yes gene_type:complete